METNQPRLSPLGKAIAARASLSARVTAAAGTFEPIDTLDDEGNLRGAVRCVVCRHAEARVTRAKVWHPLCLACALDEALPLAVDGEDNAEVAAAIVLADAALAEVVS